MKKQREGFVNALPWLDKNDAQKLFKGFIPSVIEIEKGLWNKYFKNADDKAVILWDIFFMRGYFAELVAFKRRKSRTRGEDSDKNFGVCFGEKEVAVILRVDECPNDCNGLRVTLANSTIFGGNNIVGFE